MTLQQLPDEIVAHILSYVSPAGIIVICGGHVYPLKHIVLKYAMHTTPAVCEYMRTHPYNNMYLRYSADISAKIPEPVFATRRRLNLQKTVKPRSIRINSTALYPLYTYAYDNTYSSHMMQIVDNVVNAAASILTAQVAHANKILHDCDIKLGLLNNIRIHETIHRANIIVKMLRITYYNMRPHVPACNCKCGAHLVYFPRKKHNVDVVCSSVAAEYTRAYNFTHRMQFRVMTNGRYTGQQYREIYRRYSYIWRVRITQYTYTTNSKGLYNYIIAALVCDKCIFAHPIQ
jgi:hypothetical protein